MKEVAVDKLRKSILTGHESDLSDKQLEMKKRCIAIWSMLLNPQYSYSTGEVVKALASEPYQLSQAQAYRSIQVAKKLFGNMELTNRKAELYINLQRAESAFSMARELAIEEEEKGIELMVKAIRAINEILRELDDGSDTLDASKLQPNAYRLALPKKLLAPLTQALERGFLDFNELPIQFESAENVEHEELPAETA